ncbi:MAG: putative TIM-barrel fold metal-dependent hydrolase [Sulfurimonas sp.]|jgi:predicted TIM-barrel fold metal-dependent hydrolase
MQRRNFLKTAATATVGAAGLAVIPGTVLAEDTNKAIKYPKQFRVDSYAHFSSEKVLDFLEDAVRNPKVAGLPPIKGFKHVYRSLFGGVPTIIDPVKRIALMEKQGIDMTIIVPTPWIETIPAPYITKEVSLGAAQLMNNEMSALVKKYPKHFRAVAVLPTLDKDQMIGEFRRAVKELGMVGGTYMCGYSLKRPDHEDYFSPKADENDNLYAEADRLGVPLWLHPGTSPTKAEYADEENLPFPAPQKMVSKYQTFQAFTWLSDSTNAMGRIVFAGVFEKHPKLKIVIHHAGALVPLYKERATNGWNFFEQNIGFRYSEKISKPYAEHYKNFYIDTATQGHTPELLKTAIEFFGVDKTLFGSDAPMDAESGAIFMGGARSSLEAINLPVEDVRKIYSGNISKLIGLNIPS